MSDSASSGAAWSELLRRLPGALLLTAGYYASRSLVLNELFRGSTDRPPGVSAPPPPSSIRP